MKFPILTSKSVAAISLGLTITLSSTLSLAQDGHTRVYDVKITNIMSASQFTPVLAATHTRRASLFALGKEPRVGLAMIAEGGDTSTLQNTLSNSPNVGSVQTTAFPGDVPLTFAGTTLEFTIESDKKFRYLSIASMILPTNDSFMALDTVPLPTSGSQTYYALGYDAGSEINDELCVNIPGPTCGGDGSFSGINGEGFVHISPGIHGKGDLDNSVYDWRNPIALVVVTRVQ